MKEIKLKAIADSKILITKKREEVSESFFELENIFNEIIYLPTIKIISIIDENKISFIKSNFINYDYLIFTSKNAVEIFFNNFNLGSELIYKKEIIAIGEASKNKLYEYNINNVIIPTKFSSQGLIEYFTNKNIVGKNFLIPCSKLSSDELKNNLGKLGAYVDLIPIYDNVINFDFIDLIKKLKNELPDVFIFTSPSSFKNFITLFDVKDYDLFFKDRIISAIGKTTEFEINKHGLIVNVVPENYSLDYLAEALIKFFNLQKNIA